MNIEGILKKVSSEFPDQVAVVSKNQKFTYSQIQEMVNQLAAFLLKKGVRKGDRVVILLRNNIEMVVSLFAILKIGAIEVGLNPSSDSPHSITSKFKDCKPKALITSGVYMNYVYDALLKTSSLKFIILATNYLGKKQISKKSILLAEIFQTSEYRKARKSFNIKQSDIGSIAYTSGTSGISKGVMLSHKNIMASAEVARNDLTFNGKVLPDNRCFVLVPLSHTFGKQILYSRFMKGSTIFLLENLGFLGEIMATIYAEKVTGIVTVPTVFSKVLEEIVRKKSQDKFQFIRYIHVGGSAPSAKHIKTFREIFPDAILLNGYGLTEAGPRISIMRFVPGKDLENKKINSCGRISSGCVAKILDEKGNKLKTGQKGEIVFSGPNVMKGYWKNVKETRKVLKKGWLHTGDVGMMDEDGYLYLSDRKKDIIKVGGLLIAPREIEQVINSHAEVKESAVIGIVDEIMGETIKAFIVLKDGSVLKEEDIREYCSKRLPPIKVPSSVEFFPLFPKSALEKTKKDELLFGQILLVEKFLTKKTLEKVLEKQKQEGGRLGQLLIDMRFLNKKQIVRVLSIQKKLRYGDITEIKYFENEQ